ncbi:bifunctional [glutamate--ammonia ligase]-adenylyl-L-tyrosine phosphorylase/[glutamate--ammonia-ligase] adenylyltransferase [Gallaecimonas sp. GXIMD4217]|uniref:bifunctional [glutamate--ammonia ligase]-adenylyl-L-tyrosine phosphorylase/[glutamate--ammonia-ligase] adenylyltransferase n=1 Tax=Gallaecimonas sp. GXIMD4217 TaxID=3131927 RepID=UPI00311AEACD
MSRLQERHPEQLAELSREQQQRLGQRLACSDFLLECCLGFGDWPAWLLALTPADLKAMDAGPELRACTSEAELWQALRLWRKRWLCALIWLSQDGQMDEVARIEALSRLAETLIVAARDWLYEQQCALRGTPCDAEGRPQPLLVLGMGKLGGGELNFSSDIDLIFTYPRAGETRGGRRSYDNQEFFVKLGQKLIQALDQVTTDGFVYRVDMRLRPYGESGPLVLSFDALEDYYQSQGREWERYAMIKARCMGRAGGHEDELSELLRPFVYRRYLDYSALASLRDMKRLIETEIRRRGLKDNLKLGPGGIREVEFLVQVFQLIRGGREPTLRTQSLLAALEELVRLGVLTDDEGRALRAAYLFLRCAENNLQAIADKQTQTLPSGELDRLRLAALQGFASWQDFSAELARHQALVHRLFRESIGDEPQAESELPEALTSITAARWSSDELARLLLEGGVSLELDQELAEAVANLLAELAARPMGERGRRRLEKLLPMLLWQLRGLAEPVATVARLTALLKTLVSRTVYLELLLENPGARAQLIKLLAASRLVADQLTAMPLLLDELIDPRHLHSPLPLQDYQPELDRYLLRIEPDDLEGQMEALRQFKAAQSLRIAAADLSGVMPLMKVSDHLSRLAETIVAACIQLAWRSVAVRHGSPPAQGPEDLLVLGYGKLGGLELGYGSDLDLVFLVAGGDSQTDGERPIGSRQFYLKVVQKLTHLLSTRTLSGVLYEIDTRLRPSGASGLLVSTLDAFADYQHKEAWCWEHQALSRARSVHGRPVLRQRFEQTRLAVLAKARAEEELKAEVVAMRDKMRSHLDGGRDGLLDLKQGPGGITDIEFLVQYLLLRHGHEHPRILTFSDNVRQLEALAAEGILAEADAESLKRTYLALREAGHRQVLQGQDRLVPADTLLAERQAVQALWQKTFA